MPKHSKRYLAARETARDEGAVYDVDETVRRVKQGATAKFDETIEVAIKLGVNPSRGEETVRGTITLPHGTGKVPRVAVFAKGDAALEAEAAGADRVGAEDLVEAIAQGWSEFDILVAHPEVMRIVGRLGKQLGPRMPSKKAGNITTEVGAAIQELKAGRVEFKMDKGAVLHVPIGKASFSEEQLKENLAVLISAVVRARPAAFKGRYIRSIVVSSTMGPGVRLDLQEALAQAA
jgi:large subunit ribosomal protein L1